jgi:phospholipase C
VPLLVVSPWSKGGWVNSQVFDHTSLIRFIEARFGHGRPDLIESNITPWRRAVTGNLTTAFDFARPEAWRNLTLPSTDAYLPPDFQRHPDFAVVAPSIQTLPDQELGVRPARALPYKLDAQAHVGNGSVRIDFLNAGAAAAVFQVRSANSAHTVRTYTVEPGKQLADDWAVVGTGAPTYDLTVHGPNGFFRAFKGTMAAGQASLSVELQFEEQSRSIQMTITNVGTRRITANALNVYGRRDVAEVLSPGESASKIWSVARFWGWYDFIISVQQDATFEYRLAGHLENGQDSITDPLMGGLV